MYTLGLDIGSSSVKASLLELASGACLASVTVPDTEAPIKSVRKGFAEQDPQMWWDFVCAALGRISSSHSLSGVAAIGISYQMHGLVALDAHGSAVRDSIIWCDSRAVGMGERAFEAIGPDRCMEHLLNSPGNFTASKLAWVRENEPDIYSRIWKFMLPGDYIAYRFCGEVSTTATGLSEQILWDFREGCRADFVAAHYGIDTSLVPDVVPSIGVSVRTGADIERRFGIPAGTPISYRAGDQPNNAFSLNVLKPGEVAATGGTSGVVYGVTDVPKADRLSRVNTFLHVNSTPEAPRLGVLLCINGTGILNSWLRRNLCPGMNYNQMNELALGAPVGSDGLLVHPFGNGAERVLGNRNVGAGISGLDLVRHSTAHLLRAGQEGIAFSFRHGMDIMRGLGLDPGVIRAGNANLFLSPLFRSTLSTICDARIEIYDTDGSLGAARGAALGAGLYKSPEEAFSTLSKVGETLPEPTWKSCLTDAYAAWTAELEKHMQ